MRTEGLQRVPLSLDMRGFNNFGGRMKALKALFVAALVGATSTMTAYAEKLNPEKKKEPCLSFIEKTNSETCAILKKQLVLTKSKITNVTRNKSLKDLASSLQPTIDTNSKIKYLD